MGDPSILIDRFDVRANLDTYTKPKPLDIKYAVVITFYLTSHLEKPQKRKLLNASATMRAIVAWHTTIFLKVCYLLKSPYFFLVVTEQLALKQIEREEKYSDSLSKKHDDENPKDKK